MKHSMVGMTVTWESGDIRATVVNVGDASLEALVELAADYKSPCGRVFPKGLRVNMPVSVLRTLN